MTIYTLRIQICRKKRISLIILFWGWDWDHQSYSREGSGFLGTIHVQVHILHQHDTRCQTADTCIFPRAHLAIHRTQFFVTSHLTFQVCRTWLSTCQSSCWFCKRGGRSGHTKSGHTNEWMNEWMNTPPENWRNGTWKWMVSKFGISSSKGVFSFSGLRGQFSGVSIWKVRSLIEVSDSNPLIEKQKGVSDLFHLLVLFDFTWNWTLQCRNWTLQCRLEEPCLHGLSSRVQPCSVWAHALTTYTCTDCPLASDFRLPFWGQNIFPKIGGLYPGKKLRILQVIYLKTLILKYIHYNHYIYICISVHHDSPCLILPSNANG